jgi:protein-S-isoprenylcysteine O-methyltransferase Ste14
MRDMTGQTYLRLLWGSWVIAVLFCVQIASWGVPWWAIVLMVLFLLSGIVLNLRGGRRTAAAVEAKRNGGG